MNYYVVIMVIDRLRLKCDSTRAETRFLLLAKRTSPFKSAGASVQSTTGSRGVRIRGSNAGYTMFRGSVKSTGYPLHSPVSPSLPLLSVTLCHHISTGLYNSITLHEKIISSKNDFKAFIKNGLEFLKCTSITALTVMCGIFISGWMLMRSV
jgi:hypothetical protein